jgi:hypothetical protein
MARSIVAALIDSMAVGALAYGAFRLAVAVAPCSDPGACSILTPLVVICVLVLVTMYFLVGYAFFRSTVGQRVVAE